MNKQLVLVLGISAVIFSMSATGQTAGSPQAAAPAKAQRANPENFEKIKAADLKNLQARVQIFQQTESCVQAAGNFAQLKACHEKERDAQKQLREQMRADFQAIRGQKGPRPAQGGEPGK